MPATGSEASRVFLPAGANRAVSVLGLISIQSAVLILILTVPLIMTLDSVSYRINLAGGLLLLLLAAIRPLRFEKKELRPADRHRIGACLIVAGLFAVAWQWHHGDLWLNSQLLLYLGAAVAFPVCRDAFLRVPELVPRLVFAIKVATVVGASLLILTASVQLAGDVDEIYRFLRRPIIYRNLRHFNYDQILVIAACVMCLSLTRSQLLRYGSLILLASMAYLITWTGGRGVTVAVAILLAVIGVFRIVGIRILASCVTALLTGALIALILGQADMMITQAERSVTEGMITSGRFALWVQSLDIWLQSPSGIFFGFGPDAMRTYVRAEIGFPPVVQAHNVFVQVLLEFGLIGLGVFCYLLWLVVRKVMNVLVDRSAPAEARLVAATLAAMGAYMLVDGILYHAIPLIFVMLMTAYLFSYRLAVPARPER